MHSVIGLAFAVIRGVGTQQQKSLGGKGPNQLVDERLRGRQKRDILRSICEII